MAPRRPCRPPSAGRGYPERRQAGCRPLSPAVSEQMPVAAVGRISAKAAEPARKRQARDSMLGLMKTCQKLGLSFWHSLGGRLGIDDEDHAVAPLASMVAART
ncbi:hypothetical protein A4U53_008645 (plasmid) [Rhizobium ruizarguesonis]|uniref:Uncharacterized protein n=1 Tax=Rhizobium ruizarguesonis TaxID=2081791 RepID=A0ACD5EIH0_9HYPH|nr:hypothetical protein [Rhizobium leguminosarum]